MKFRLDYVTNSSSSSYIFARLDSQTLVEILQKNGFEDSVEEGEVSFGDDTGNDVFAPYGGYGECPSEEEMKERCTLSSKEQIIDSFIDALKAKIEYYEDYGEDREEKEKLENLVRNIYQNMEAIISDLKFARISRTCSRDGNDVCDGQMKEEKLEITYDGKNIEASSEIVSNPLFETPGIGKEESRRVVVETPVSDNKIEIVD